MFRKKNYTKWIPLGSFTHIADYVVMVRKNKNNGMLQFKVKRMHGRLMFGNCEPFFRAKIDTQAAWDEIVSK